MPSFPLTNHQSRFTVRLEFFLVLFTTLLMTLALFFYTDRLNNSHPMWQELGDFHSYHYMATHPILTFHLAPFCWRVVTPWIARLISLEIHKSFELIAVTGIWWNGIILFYFFKAWPFPNPLPWIGSLFFYSLGWAVKYNLYNVWMSEPLAHLILACLFLLLVTKHDIIFLVVLTFGVMIKESLIFVVPLYYTFRARRFFDAPWLLRCLVMGTPPVVVLLLLRHVIPEYNNDPEYLESIKLALFQPGMKPIPFDYLLRFQDFSQRRVASFSLQSIHSFMTHPFGVALVSLCFLGIKKNIGLFLRCFPFIFLVYLQLVFASNTERLIVFAHPAVLLLALSSIQHWSKRLNLNPKLFLLLPIFLFASNFRHPEEMMPPLRIQVYVLCGFLLLLYQSRVKAK